MSDRSGHLGFLRFALSGRNRFVSGIALLAALGGLVAILFFRSTVPETKHRFLEEIERDIGGERLARAAAQDGESSP